MEIPKNNPESIEETPRPNTLDIVKIDGRWAQSNGNIIVFLDDGSGVFINWNDFSLIKKYECTVGALMLKKEESFTDAEIESIHWGPEQNQYPHLKKAVTVFGEYERKD
ncbi:MAG: hypothetical protein WC757_04505 [Candidatus Paceibacterota bacterium]|jgi:hypothetical protein